MYAMQLDFKLFSVKLVQSDLSLTYAVAENDGQNHSYSHSDQGGALPGAMFRWLLELESPSGQAVSGQRACRCGVNRPCRHGVTGCRCAKERCRSGARFKKKVPGEGGKKRKIRIVQITVKWVMFKTASQKHESWSLDLITVRANLCQNVL